MEATYLVAMLVLVQSLALASDPASSSAPAQSPHTSAPAQSTFSKNGSAEVMVINASATVQSASTSQAQAASTAKDGKSIKRRLFIDGKDGTGREYWIVDYQ